MVWGSSCQWQYRHASSRMLEYSKERLALLDAGRPVFICVRAAEEYASGALSSLHHHTLRRCNVGNSGADVMHDCRISLSNIYEI